MHDDVTAGQSLEQRLDGLEDLLAQGGGNGAEIGRDIGGKLRPRQVDLPDTSGNVVGGILGESVLRNAGLRALVCVALAITKADRAELASAAARERAAAVKSFISFEALGAFRAKEVLKTGRARNRSLEC